MELYHGQLPWQDSPKELMGKMKDGPELHAFLSQSLPEFTAYHAHCSSRSFGEKPDYGLLKGLFRSRMQTEGWAYDWIFDWEDGASLSKGTLIPEEYVFDLEYVDRIGLDPW